MTGNRCSRALRAAVFAAVCVLLAVIGHVLMSGTSVSWWGVGGALALTAVAAWALTGRERGPLLVASAAVAVQTVLHFVFSFAQSAVHPSVSGAASFGRQWVSSLRYGGGPREGDGAPGVSPGVSHPAAHHPAHVPTPSAGRNGTAGHSGTVDHGGTVETAGTEPFGAGVDPGHDMGGMSPLGMLAAHLLAALLCGLWLGYGERAAFRIARAFTGWLFAPLRLVLRRLMPVRAPRNFRVRRGWGARRPRLLLLSHAITSRGPPRERAAV
ncbi:hypothetical protein ACWF94_05550 [Streptomyces sp. NPDC055078]